MSADTGWIIAAIGVAVMIFAPVVDRISKQLERIIHLLHDIKIGRRDL